MSDQVSAYDYSYPPSAVAQVPAGRREDARLMCVTRRAREGRPVLPAVGQECRVADLPDVLRPGDLVIVNDVAVSPARLAGERVGTGGRVTVLVLSHLGGRATVLLGTRGRLAPGEQIAVAGERWTVLEALGEGRFVVEAEAGASIGDLLDRAGRMPLPPYIDRDPVLDDRDDLDRDRYRTTFASGDARAVAAPTAGLHLTPALLDGLRERGVAVARLRLDVGEGTFRPLRGDSLDEHRMHRETFEVPAATAQAFAETRAARGRIVAVGTTVMRTLESVVSADGRSLAVGPGSTDLFLRPGATFRAVDVLMTNFHQPRSTLLVLIAAFAGYDTMRAAYEHAVASGYRLFSYGDAMLLQPRDSGGGAREARLPP